MEPPKSLILRPRYYQNRAEELQNQLTASYNHMIDMANQLNDDWDILVSAINEAWPLVELRSLRPGWRIRKLFLCHVNRISRRELMDLIPPLWPECLVEVCSKPPGIRNPEAYLKYLMSWEQHYKVKRYFLSAERQYQSCREGLLSQEVVQVTTSHEFIEYLHIVGMNRQQKLYIPISAHRGSIHHVKAAAEHAGFHLVEDIGLINSQIVAAKCDEMFMKKQDMPNCEAAKYAESKWKMLKVVMDECYDHKKASRLAFQEPYRSAYNLIRNGFGEQLYYGLERTLSHHLKLISKSIVEAPRKLLLEELSGNWEVHNSAMHHIEAILQYMDRTVVPKNSKATVHELGLKLWRDIVMCCCETQARFSESSGLVTMLEECGYDGLRAIYRSYARVQDGQALVRIVMASYITETGKKLVTTGPESSTDAVGFVQGLLDLKDKYDKTIRLAFDNDKTFQDALNSCIRYFLKSNVRSPEYLALFLDGNQRKALGGGSEEDLEAAIDQAMVLFRFLEDKKAFELKYRQHLANRFLSLEAVSHVAESRLVDRLEGECDEEFVLNLKCMLADMQACEGTMSACNSTASSQQIPALSTQVLHRNSWPIQPSQSCKLPPEILSVCEEFAKNYTRRGILLGNKLCWHTEMGTAVLEATLRDGQVHKLKVTTYQMCVLKLFEVAERLTYKEIEDATGIPAIDLKRCLQSLACVKGKDILLKEPMSEDVNEGDVFLCNENFTTQQVEVDMSAVVVPRLLGCGPQPEPEVQERSEEDVNFLIVSSIMNIMRARQKEEYKTVLEEVKACLGIDSTRLIKTRIESLIEEDRLARDKSDHKLLWYVA